MINEAIIDNKTQSGVPVKEFVTTAGEADEAATVAVVAMGFSTDPVARWAYPEPGDYLRFFPAFIRGLAGRAFESKTAYIADGFTGAALWLPPGVGPDVEKIVPLVESTTSAAVQRDLFPVLEQMDEFHPREPHWYLPMIAVDTYCQGNGIGSKLMRHALARCDRDGIPAYLESSNPKNISLYQRFGFESLGIIQHGASPPMFPMTRKPHAAGIYNNN